MKVICGKSQLERETIGETSVTVGTFDGVHRGHVALIERLVKAARDTNSLATLLTFDPHPQLILGRKGCTEVLNTKDEKLHLLSKLNLDLVVILEFNQQLASLDAGNFIQRILIEHLNMKHFVIGYDHSFGKDRQGNFEMARSLSERYGYSVEMVGPVYDDGRPIKSSSIRRELKTGDYDEAAAMLGYKYFLTGDVIKGYGAGRRLGYPTLNLNIPPGKLIPKDGVYAAWAEIDDVKYAGMAYIGGRLTFGDQTICVEANLFNFSGDALGKSVKLSLEKYTRPPIKFESPEYLVAALAKDEMEIKRILNI
ncbi:MAG: bifunctional riboflavin kinase/FAD synthetase [candidate division Zixibacteria bacterium]|nr:bifunctional riboflavin kinase/FAD synthetase [candidate division Zixibacteria bacterium]